MTSHRLALPVSAAAVLLLGLAPTAGHAADQLFQHHLADKPGGGYQKCRVFVPAGEGPLRGVIVDIAFSHASDRQDYQAFARHHRWAVIGAKMAYATLGAKLRAALPAIAERCGHPELVHVPWVTNGFSAAVGPAVGIGLADPDRVLAVMIGGVGYGPRAEDLAAARRLPVMGVMGSADPFLAGPDGVADLVWFHQHWPKVRALGLPWGCGIHWGGAHTPGTGFVLHAAALRDIQAARVPAGWDPRGGPPALRDMIPEAAGWLGDIATWATPHPTVAPAADFAGDRLRAHWLPGAYSAAVWRAYAVRDPQVALRRSPGDDGVFSVEVTAAGLPAPGAVAFFDGDRALGAGPAIAARDLPGLVCLSAVATIAGAPHVTRPLLLDRGAIVAMGEEAARASRDPINVIDLAAGPRATAVDLLARAAWDGPKRWRTLHASDFRAGQGAWAVGALPGEVMVTDGALQIAAKGQMLCALPWDFPRDLAIEYRCRQVGEPRNVMAMMMAGAEGGPRPWRAGAIFHVGAAGQRTAWQVGGETDADLGVHSRPDHWHRIRLERVDRVLRAWIDGVELPARRLNDAENEAVFGTRVGVHVVGTSAQFDDIVIAERVPEDPAAVQPALPDDARLAELAQALLALSDHQFGEPRDLAGHFLRRFAVPLGATLRAIDPAALPERARLALAKALVTNAPPALAP